MSSANERPNPFSYYDRVLINYGNYGIYLSVTDACAKANRGYTAALATGRELYDLLNERRHSINDTQSKLPWEYHWAWHVPPRSLHAERRGRAATSAAGMAWYHSKRGDTHVRVYGRRIRLSRYEADPPPFMRDYYDTLHPVELVYPFLSLPGHVDEVNYYSNHPLLLELFSSIREDPFDEATWAATCDVLNDVGAEARSLYVREQMRRAMYIRDAIKAKFVWPETDNVKLCFDLIRVCAQLEQTMLPGLTRELVS